MALYAQSADPTGGWGPLLADAGPWTLAIAILIVICRLLWTQHRDDQREIRRLQETATEKVVPLVVEATRGLSDAVDVLKSAPTPQEMHDLKNDLAGTRSSVEELTREFRRRAP